MKNVALLISITLFVAIAGCSSSKDDPLKFENYLVVNNETTTALHFTNSDVGCVVTESGNIYRTTDGGKSFSLAGNSGGRRLNDVYFVNDNLGIACGSRGALLRTSDAGSAWSLIAVDTTIDLTGIGFPDDEFGVVAGNVNTGEQTGFGAIGTSSDKGMNWRFTVTEQTGFSRVDVVPSDHAWILGDESLNYTTDRGQSWDHAASRVQTVNYLLFTDVQDGWQVGDNGLLRHSSDGGWSWQDKLKMTEANLSCLAAPEPGQIYIAGDNFVAVSTNYGRNWIMDDVSHKTSFVDMHSVGHDIFILGNKGELIRMSY
ncbi:MAG: YCF48-related protein [Candidatus Zixiibacteriota bacterium]